MIATQTFLELNFDRLNAQCFASRLPRPALRVSHARTRLGYFACRRGAKDCLIAVSDRFDVSERELQNVLIHEMIHYEIALSGRRDSSPHGVIFRTRMQEINSKYGWNITVSSRTKPISKSETAQPKSRLVLALKTKHHGCFITVVNPNYQTAIRHQLMLNTNVVETHWFTTTDPRFADFTVVRSLRGRRISTLQYDAFCRELNT